MITGGVGDGDGGAARRGGDAATATTAAAATTTAATGNWLRVEGCDLEGDHRLTDS